MEGPVIAIERVLIASRGEVARRLIRQFREAGVETVAVFSEPDVEQPWVEEADYAVYLMGRTVGETYLDPRRVVSAAMDAGCDAIHPGYCFLAERVDFVQMAMLANLLVIGGDPRALARAVDRFDVRRVARDLGIPIVPASERLAPDDDGVGAGALLGFPLYVKAPAGQVAQRVTAQDQLPTAVARVRDIAALLHGDRTVYLERAVDHLRRCGTVVVADRHDTVVHLGETDGSLGLGVRSWVEEMGEALVGDLHQRLGEAAVEVARAIGWTGVGRVRWALTPDGGWYLLGFSGRLTTGYTLSERVLGLDLVHTQLRMFQGEPLTWGQEAVKPTRHGVQLRIFPVDVTDPLADVEGQIERLDLPEGDENVLVEAGTAAGQPCNRDTDPLLVKLTITGPTRHAALVRARAALEELVIEGVPTNRDFLLELLADERVWRGEYDTHTVASMLAERRP